MKHILYTLLCCALILLASCSKEDAPMSGGSGYLSVSSIELQNPAITTVTSRADSDTPSDELIVEIWKEGNRLHQLSEAEANGKIKLDAGNYELKVYSSNYGGESQWTNDDKGAPVYYKEQSFTIADGETCFLTVEVPMLVYGVQLMLPEGFDEWFSAYTFTVTSGDRSVQLQANETAYFTYSDNTPFRYTLSVTNGDGEKQESTGTYGADVAIKTGTLYQINYNLSTQTLSASAWSE